MIAQTLKNLPPFSPSQAGRHPIFIQNPLDSSTQRFHHYSRCSAFSMINRHDWVVIEFPRGRKPAPCSKKLRLLVALSGQDSTCTLREICVRHTFYACLTRARFASVSRRRNESTNIRIRFLLLSSTTFRDWNYVNVWPVYLYLTRAIRNRPSIHNEGERRDHRVHAVASGKFK